jgi:hypothetical protein
MHAPRSTPPSGGGPNAYEERTTGTAAAGLCLAITPGPLTALACGTR